MQKYFLIVCVCLLGAFTCWKSMSSDFVSDDLFLENVEALADEEYIVPIHCEGSGELTCPKIGRKVRDVFQGLSLQPNEESY